MIRLAGFPVIAAVTTAALIQSVAFAQPADTQTTTRRWHNYDQNPRDWVSLENGYAVRHKRGIGVVPQMGVIKLMDFTHGCYHWQTINPRLSLFLSPATWFSFVIPGEFDIAAVYVSPGGFHNYLGEILLGPGIAFTGRPGSRVPLYLTAVIAWNHRFRLFDVAESGSNAAMPQQGILDPNTWAMVDSAEKVPSPTYFQYRTYDVAVGGIFGIAKPSIGYRLLSYWNQGSFLLCNQFAAGVSFRLLHDRTLVRVGYMGKVYWPLSLRNYVTAEIGVCLL